MLVPWQPIDAGLGEVAQDQSVAQERRLDRGHSAEHPRVCRIDIPDLRQLQERRIQGAAAIELGVAAEHRVPTLTLDLVTKLIAELFPAIDRPVESVFADRSDAAIKRGPE